MNLIFELISLSLFLFSYVQFFAKDIANSKSYVISLYVIILLILIGVLYSLFTESYQIFNDESFNGFESLYGSSDLYGYSLLIGICFLCLLNQQNKTIFNHISALIFLISLLLSKSPISTLMGIIIYIIYYFLFFKDSANKTIKNYKIICISLIILIISLNIIVVLSELSLLGNFGVHISEIISFNLSYFGLLWARFTDAVSTMFVLLSNRVNMAIGFGYKIGDLILYRTSVRPFSFVFTLAMNCGLAGLLAYLIIFAFFVYASIKTIIKMKQNGIYVSIFICSILFLTSVVDNSISIFYMILLILVLLPNIVKFQNCSYNLEAEKKK